MIQFIPINLNSAHTYRADEWACTTMIFFFCHLACDTLKEDAGCLPNSHEPVRKPSLSLSVSPGDELRRRRVLKLDAPKVPVGFLQQWPCHSLSPALHPSPPHPCLSPLPSSWWAPWDSRRQWQEGPTLSCERKPRNECHGLQGARLEWQQNNGGRYERHWTYSTQTHTHTHKHTHTRRFFKRISIINTERWRYFSWSNLASAGGRGGSCLRWVKFDIKWKHVCEIYLRCCRECFRVFHRRDCICPLSPGRTGARLFFFDYIHLSVGFII